MDLAAVKEKNYISAVVYLGDENGSAESFINTLCSQLSSRFENYELVFVEDRSRDGTEAEVREALAVLENCPPVTIVHLSLKQGLELAMNAGLDAAVGDFVYEFDSMKLPCQPELIFQAYDTCLEGNDIVSIAPAKNRSLAGGLFYKLFNANAHSRYPLHTDTFRLLSRRAINRVHAITPSMPYRKAAYAASGLKMETIVYQGGANGATEHTRFTRAVDSLALYTNVAYRVSFIVAMVMLVLMVAAVVYTVVVYFLPGLTVAPGWTTTMLMLTGGFFGVFLLLAFVLKYLSLLVELVFRKQTYLVESVEKLK